MCVLIYSLSFICYLLSFFYANFALLVLSIPFLLLLCAIIHELGHCLGCCINSNTITVIATPIFTYNRGKISIVNTFIPKSYCSFIKSKDDSLVYILGPIISLLFVLLTGGIYILFEKHSLAILSIVAIVVFLINIVPGKNGDLISFIKEKNK